MVINRIVRVCMYIHYKDSYSGWLGRPSPIEGVDRPSHISSRSSLASKALQCFGRDECLIASKVQPKGLDSVGWLLEGWKTVKRGLAGSPFKTPGFGSSTHMGMAQFYHRRYAKFTLQVVWGEFLLWLVVAELSKSTCAQKCSTLSVYVTSLPHLTKHRLNVFC